MNISGSDRCRIRYFFSIFIPVNELKNTYFMQTNNEYLDEWPVRPYSKRELAMAYAPDIQSVFRPQPLGGMGPTASEAQR